MFNIPKRFDANLAKEGRWIDVFDGDVEFGGFLMKHLDRHSAAHDAYVRRYHKMHPREKDEAHFIKTLIVDKMIDWRGITDADGEAVEFSKENAKAYFDTDGTRYVLDTLIVQAGTSDFYRADEDEKKD